MQSQGAPVMDIELGSAESIRDPTGYFRAAARHSPAVGVVAEFLSGWMNFRDDPAHRRLREPVDLADWLRVHPEAYASAVEEFMRSGLGV